MIWVRGFFSFIFKRMHITEISQVAGFPSCTQVQCLGHKKPSVAEGGGKHEGKERERKEQREKERRAARQKEREGRKFEHLLCAGQRVQVLVTQDEKAGRASEKPSVW